MIAIDWTNAPEWANYLAMDDDGSWWWYELEPNIDRGEFYSDGAYEMALITGPHLIKRHPAPAELNTMDCQGGQ